MLLKRLKCYLDSNTQSSYAHYSSLTSCLDSFALCYIRQIIILLVMVYYPFFIKSLAKLYFDHLSSINSLYCLISLLSCVFFVHTLLWNRQLSTSEMDQKVLQVIISSFTFLRRWLAHPRLSHQASSLKDGHSITHEIISSCALSKVSDFFLGYNFHGSLAGKHLWFA